MKVQVHAIHFTADRKLVESIQEKLNKLDTFYDRITGGEVFLKVATSLGKVKEKMLEIKITVPGAVLFVKETAKSFEEALDLALNAIAEQIKRFKSKNNSVKALRAEDLESEEFYKKMKQKRRPMVASFHIRVIKIRFRKQT